LPEVAAEMKWNKEKALKSLVEKSGYSGRFKNVVGKIKLTRYQSIKAHLSYNEYQKQKDN
jgi:AMMECR1 domain-containing protein